MAQLGRLNELKVVRIVDFGIYLEADEFGAVLLPKSEVPEAVEVEDLLEVFIYLDKDGLPLATLKPPKICLGEFAALKVVSVEKIGVFLDWGLSKDLFLPYGELRNQTPQVGDQFIVYLYLDNSKRLCASARLERFLDKTTAEYKAGQQVELLITGRSDLGYNAIIDHSHWGLLHNNEVFRKLSPGYKTRGFIKRLQDEGKIDLALDKPGYAKVDRLQQKILKRLEANDGFSPLHDKSAPEAIYHAYGISKKAYKMALGGLYRQRLVRLEQDGVYLAE